MDNNIRATMMIKTGNPELVDKIFQVAHYDDHMGTMINLWYNMSDDKELGPWILDEIKTYLLEADDYNVGTC